MNRVQLSIAKQCLEYANKLDERAVGFLRQIVEQHEVADRFAVPHQLSQRQNSWLNQLHKRIQQWVPTGANHTFGYPNSQKPSDYGKHTDDRENDGPLAELNPDEDLRL